MRPTSRVLMLYMKRLKKGEDFGKLVHDFSEDFDTRESVRTIELDKKSRFTCTS